LAESLDEPSLDDPPSDAPFVPFFASFLASVPADPFDP
jgi:hypothetical protein